MFEEFKIASGNKSSETVESLCTSDRGLFALQNHQKFLKAYISSSVFQKNNRLLLFHGLGSGKTCSAISIANAFRSRNPKAKIIVITPASLVSNFYKEMKGLCGITQFKELRKTPVNTATDNTPCVVVDEVDKVLTDIISVMSYQKFLKNRNSIGPFDKNTLFVIDEVQNIVSATGSMYVSFSKILSKTKAALVLLSGTPIFDKPNEIAMIGNLLNTEKKLPIRFNEFMSKHGVISENNQLFVKNKEMLEDFFTNKISYFRGSNPIAYPNKTEYSVYCPMSPFQYEGYLNAIGNEKQFDIQFGVMSTTFLISPRQCSNTVYPNGDLSINTAKRFEKMYFSSKKHAIKFHTCVKVLLKSAGPVFVYSNFVSSCGINTFASVLKNEFSFEEITPNFCPISKGKYPRYAVFRTGQPIENTRILQIYNSPQNKKGDLIKVILGSPAMKEGVTLLRTREVHLLDPYWNRSRVEQIMGRGVRFCSHKDLPMKERQVDVYHYYAVDPESNSGVFPSNTDRNNNNKDSKTVDIHIRDMGKMKEKYNKMYETILKEVAIDCSLFKEANEPPFINCKQKPNNNKVNNNKVTNNNNQVGNNKNNNINNNNNNLNNNNRINVSVMKISNNNKLNNVVKNSSSSIDKKKKKPLKFGKKSVSYRPSSEKKPSLKGCPKPRQVDNKTGECPSKYPYKRINKYDTPCCYKNKGSKPAVNINTNTTTDFSLSKCMSFSKKQLKEMAKDFGYSSGPITKKRLCQLMVV